MYIYSHLDDQGTCSDSFSSLFFPSLVLTMFTLCCSFYRQYKLRTRMQGHHPEKEKKRQRFVFILCGGWVLNLVGERWRPCSQGAELWRFRVSCPVFKPALRLCCVLGQDLLCSRHLSPSTSISECWKTVEKAQGNIGGVGRFTHYVEVCQLVLILVTSWLAIAAEVRLSCHKMF